MSKATPVKPQSAQIHLNEYGLPVATAFDDIYFNNEDGLCESRYVFLQHNDLPQRWQTHPHQNFVVAETGFGTGLNFLATWQSFLQHAPAEQRLHFVSFEKYPLQYEHLQQALQHFPELQELAEQLLRAYPAPEPGCHRRQFSQGRVTLDLWLGDITDLLPQWVPAAYDSVDAWYLDGFAPARNPAMWQPEIYRAMATSSRDQGSFATFTAAGDVRRGLQQVGYQISKQKGYRHKREMLCGTLSKATRSSVKPPQRAIVVGGGIAAASMVHALSVRGCQTTLLSRGIADAASGNAQGAVYPLLHAQRTPLSEYSLAAFGFAEHFYQQQLPQHWHSSGVLQLNFTPERAERATKVAQTYAQSTVCWWTPQQTQQHWSALPPHSALWYPRGGWLNPPATVHQLTQAATSVQTDEISQISAGDEHRWRLHTHAGEVYETDYLVLAMGADLTEWLSKWQIQLQNVRGQVTTVAANEHSITCPSVICYKGYFTPAQGHQHCVGATYTRNYEPQHSSATTTAEDTENLAILSANLAPCKWPAQLRVTGQRAALRNTSRDRLPIVGELEPGLAVIGALGSRGYTAAPLAAELIASRWYGEPSAVAADMLTRLQPQRLQDAQTSP